MENENLHTPTIPSGPSANPLTNGHSHQMGFQELQRKKDNLEAELKALGSVLDSHGVDMDTPLLTRDGFPRADLDVAQIRTTRARVIRLRNDHKEVMAAAEKFLHQHFANLSDDAADTVPVSGVPVLPDSQSENLQEPFAKVNSVADGSPAATAGLRPGDEIRSFGYVDSSNHDNLRKVAECVQVNEGKPIFIKVSRSVTVSQLQELRLTLVPTTNWGGRGMLGCHILPV